MQNNFFWFIHWSKKLTFLSICILRESFPVVFFLSIIWFSFPFLWFLLAFVSWYITHFFHNIHLPHLHLSNFFNLLYFDCFFQGHLWQPIAINSSWWNQIRQSKGCCTKKRGFLSRTSFTLSDLIPSTTFLYWWCSCSSPNSHVPAWFFSLIKNWLNILSPCCFFQKNFLSTKRQYIWNLWQRFFTDMWSCVWFLPACFFLFYTVMLKISLPCSQFKNTVFLLQPFF